MNPETSTPRWRLDVVAVPGRAVPAYVRLRRVLKALLRRYGLRVVAIRVVNEEEDSTDE